MAKQSTAFAFTFVALFALAFVFMAAMDALPETKTNAGTQDVPRTSDVPDSASPEIPVRIVAKSIGLDKTVANPGSTEVETLDKALQGGTVRYPTSARLGEEGTVLIFGHSSYLPIVRNQNYKAFNGIQKLKAGETISVYSGTTEYRYAVTGVRLANTAEDVIELPATGKFLTLVTCDSFGTKSDRFVVTAELQGSYTI